LYPLPPAARKKPPKKLLLPPLPLHPQLLLLQLSKSPLKALPPQQPRQSLQKVRLLLLRPLLPQSSKSSALTKTLASRDTSGSRVFY
jgi:hypothetical protein